MVEKYLLIASRPEVCVRYGFKVDELYKVDELFVTNRNALATTVRGCGRDACACGDS